MINGEQPQLQSAVITVILLGLGGYLISALFLGQQTADAEIVDDLLDLLHVVLERVELLAQVVVLQVEEAEAGEEVVEEGGDGQGALVVAVGHAVHGEAGLKEQGKKSQSVWFLVSG